MNNETKPLPVLVLGASGMLGNAVLRLFSESDGFAVTGSLRSANALHHFSRQLQNKLVCGIDVENVDDLTKLFSIAAPKVVVNCIGLVKQLAVADDPIAAIPVNSVLPHRLARLCTVAGARLVQISTDCIFSGSKGLYTEADAPDAEDLYGRSKFLGEVDYPNAITLRTSIIGHELDSAHSLVGWFLAQEGQVKGYQRAVFSGLPTVEIARLIRDYVIPHPELRGVYHVSADPINKFDLLHLVAKVYGKKIEIVPTESLVIDRSLDSTRFRQATGFAPKPWPDLVQAMHDFG
jgi:dTDP-4-dehydrorhamnose reductase